MQLLFVTRLAIVFVLSVVASTGFSKTKTSPKIDEQTTAESILKKLNKKQGIQIPISVVTTKKVLGTEKTEKGIFSYQLGKINITLNGDKQSEMIYDGEHAYVISYPDQELDPNGKRTVIKIKSNKTNQLGLLANLFKQPKKFFSEFIIKTTLNDETRFSLLLEDKRKSLKPMTLTFSKKEQSFLSMKYSDDLESETQINFEKPTLPNKISFKLFKYNPIKSDEVIVK